MNEIYQLLDWLRTDTTRRVLLQCEDSGTVRLVRVTNEEDGKICSSGAAETLDEAIQNSQLGGSLIMGG